jgi:hypothetical protein
MASQYATITVRDQSGIVARATLSQPQFVPHTYVRVECFNAAGDRLEAFDTEHPREWLHEARKGAREYAKHCIQMARIHL